MIITGRNSVVESAKAGKVRKVFIKKGANLYDVDFDAPVEVVGKDLFEKRFGLSAQGVAAEVEDFRYSRFSPSVFLSKKGVIMLDGIMDPQNFGAIIRAAMAFGIRDVIVSRHKQAPVTDAVFRASAGVAVNANIYEVSSLSGAVDDLQGAGISILATSADADRSLRLLDVKLPLCIIIGSEGRGIKPSLLEKSDAVVSIPISEDVDSLNASQSAAIVLYEIFR